MSYCQKSDFQDGGRRHLEFLKIQLLVTWLSLGSISAVVYQILSLLVRKVIHARKQNPWAYRDELLHRCRGPRRNHLCQLLWLSLMGFERGGGSNFGFLHWLASSPLQHSRTTVRVCDYLTSNSIVALKFGLEVTEDHWNGTKLGYGFLFAIHNNCRSIVYHFSLLYIISEIKKDIGRK